MVYCPECGTRLEQVHLEFYRCPKCGMWWLVYVDSEWGDIYAVVAVDIESCETVLSMIKLGLVK